MTYSCRAPVTDWQRHPGRVLVRVLVRWRKGCKPRNVAVEDKTGRRWIRPFRGLRKEITCRAPLPITALERLTKENEHLRQVVDEARHTGGSLADECQQAYKQGYEDGYKQGTRDK